MTSSEPEKRATLTWTGSGDVYVGRVDEGPEHTVDSKAAAGPSPMDALLTALMGCMAIDVRMILEKSRVPLDSLEVHAEADRAEHPPRRFTHVTLVYALSGPGEEHRARVERAIELSRETCCSVLHTLAPDLDLEIRIEGV